VNTLVYLQLHAAITPVVVFFSRKKCFYNFLGEVYAGSGLHYKKRTEIAAAISKRLYKIYSHLQALT
ncbi:hypothetical protein ACJX0J_028167, partial [Zea mays]